MLGSVDAGIWAFIRLYKLSEVDPRRINACGRQPWSIR